jgi:thiol-disulfide isomerase/thioredoxin
MANANSSQGLSLASVLPWGALGLMVLAVIVYFERSPRQKIGTNHPAVGKKLTRLDVVPLTGNPPPLTVEDLQGRVTLINYWGTWCPPCVQEFPHLAILEREYHGRDDFRFVSVSSPAGVATKDQLAAETAAFLKGYTATDFSTYAEADLSAPPSAITSAGLLNVFPTTIITDRQGVVRGVWEGYVPGYEREMADLVKQLLAK